MLQAFVEGEVPYELIVAGGWGADIFVPEETGWYYMGIDAVGASPYLGEEPDKEYDAFVFEQEDDVGDTDEDARVIAPGQIYGTGTYGIGTGDTDVFRVWLSEENWWNIQAKVFSLPSTIDMIVTLEGRGVGAINLVREAGTIDPAVYRIPTPGTRGQYISNSDWGWYTITIRNPHYLIHNYTLDVLPVPSFTGAIDPLWPPGRNIAGACTSEDQVFAGIECHFMSPETAALFGVAYYPGRPEGRMLAHMLTAEGSFQNHWFYAKGGRRVTITARAPQEISLGVFSETILTNAFNNEGYCDAEFLWTEAGDSVELSFQAPMEGWYKVRVTSEESRGGLGAKFYYNIYKHEATAVEPELHAF